MRVCVYASTCAKLLVLAGGFRQLTGSDHSWTGKGDRREVRTTDGLPATGMDRSDPGFAPGSPESGQKSPFSKNPGMPPMVGGVGTVLSNLGHFPALFRALPIRQGAGTICRLADYTRKRVSLSRRHRTVESPECRHKAPFSKNPGMTPMVGGGRTLFVDSGASGAISGDLSRGP